MRLMDYVLPYVHLFGSDADAEGVKTTWRRTTLLVLAITLHNIPEGLAIGVAFGAVGAGYESATLAAAVALTIGIGLQNCPEGTAVSVPLRREGLSRMKAWWYGQLSASVEPADLATLGAIVGFAVMMTLDVALG
jgi:ZIP family zinc transporter